MLASPTPTIQGVEWIPGGEAGIRATVARMVALARARSLAPAVRRAAVSALRYVGGRNRTAQATVLRQWIADRVQFLPDPTLAEGLHDPLEMLEGIAQHRIVNVDCDDVAMLAASLGLSVGLHARYVVVAVVPQHQFSHVWAELGSGQAWIPVDPTRPGRGLPPLSRRWVVPVG